jgi:hypothetical protein
MSTPLVAKLQGPALDALTHLALDHLLQMPLNQLIDAPSLARQFVITLRATAHSKQTEQWIRAQIDGATSRAPSGTVRDHSPAEVVAPICAAIAHPVTPDREMVGRILEHGAVENLLRDLLVSALQGFAAKLRPSIPGSERTHSRLGRLKRASEGMLGGLGAEIERQAEQKAKDFVDSILSSVVAQAADNLCDPSKAEGYGRFRGHLFDQFLDTPITDLNRELAKIDPDTLVSTASAIMRALASRTELEAEVTELIVLGLSQIGDQTAGDLLAEAGVGDAWRPELETRLTTLARGFTATPAFEDWLSAVLQD